MNDQQHAAQRTCPNLYTIQQVQRAFNVSRSTVNRYVSRGWLTKLSLGPNSARITADSVDLLIQRLTKQAQQQ
jgi:DNA-binding transcriptional MerR regulator